MKTLLSILEPIAISAVLSISAAILICVHIGVGILGVAASLVLAYEWVKRDMVND